MFINTARLIKAHACFDGVVDFKLQFGNRNVPFREVLDTANTLYAGTYVGWLLSTFGTRAMLREFLGRTPTLTTLKGLARMVGDGYSTRAMLARFSYSCTSEKSRAQFIAKLFPNPRAKRRI